MRFSRLYRIISLVFVVLISFNLDARRGKTYHLLKKYALDVASSGMEYFDYITVDSSSRRVYLSHGTEVEIVNADTGQIIGAVSDLSRVHGIALVKDLGRGFISSGGSGEAVIFDLKTLKILGRVKTGGNPDCILYDAASGHIFTMNGDTRDATVIDPEKGIVVGTVPMGGRPEYAVADGMGMIYDNIEDKNEVAALDTRTLTIKARWPIAPAGMATSIDMDRQHRRLFIGGRNRILAIMDADSGKIIQTFPIGEGVDTTIYEPKTGLDFTSTREGIVYIIHEDSADSFHLVETVRTEFGAKTMGLDTRTHQMFLDTVDFDPPQAPTASQPHPNAIPIPGTFHLLVYGY